MKGSTVDRLPNTNRVPRRASGVAAAALALAALAFAPSAHASFLPPEMMDKADSARAGATMTMFGTESGQEKVAP